MRGLDPKIALAFKNPRVRGDYSLRIICVENVYKITHVSNLMCERFLVGVALCYRN